jgi:hypothetical protein
VGVVSGLERSARARLLAALGACALAVVLLSPASVAAASVTFETPSAKSTFGTGITFTQAYTGGTFAQAEIAITLPGDIGPTVVPVTSGSQGTLTYTLDTSSGQLAPFQPLTAHFEVVASDGTVQAGPEVSVVYADDRFAWQSVTSGILTVHWFQGTSSFAQQLLGYGVNGIKKASTFFGTTETEPIDFYIYPSQAAFAAGLSVPETIGGQAQPTYRTCFALVAPTDLSYGSTVVPHELTHIVFADTTDNPYHSPPRWLNEGLAVYLSEGYGSSNRSLVSQAAHNGTLAPLASLAGYFALDAQRIYLAYAEATSAVDFMVRKYGQAAVEKLAQAYETGITDDQAFQAAFGITVADFDKAWMADNGVAAPTPYGPQPAPTGPLPPGWTSSGGGSGGGGDGGVAQPTAQPTLTQPPAAGNGGTSPASGSTDETGTVLTISALIAGLGGVLLLFALWLQVRERARQPR